MKKVGNRKEYRKPEMEFIAFDYSDVVLASGEDMEETQKYTESDTQSAFDLLGQME